MKIIKLNYGDPIIPRDLVGEKIINNDDKWIHIIYVHRSFCIIREMYQDVKVLTEQELIELIKTKYMSSDKKIIGYKLVKPEYHAPAKRILNCLQKHDYIHIGTVTAKGDIELLQEAGVLDLWFEPVYETPEIPKGSDAEKFVEMVKHQHEIDIDPNSCGKIEVKITSQKVNIFFNKDGSFSHLYSYNQLNPL